MGLDLRIATLRADAPAMPVAKSRARVAIQSVVRFDTHQRIQHVLMMSSFITLALTGLPQKFSDLSVSQWWVSTLGGLEMVRIIHRTAGTVMLTDCVYHLSYIVYRMGFQGRMGPLRMLPTPKDGIDMAQTIFYFLGLQEQKPKFDRFNYLEKFDYWAVFWGIAMIGTSGLLLMFPVLVTQFLPGQVLPVAITIHSDEAILAVGWILIVHMFNVHLAPWVFPFSPAIFTGKMTAHQCAEDHPLEWERIVAKSGSEPVARALTDAHTPPAAIVAGRIRAAAAASTRGVRTRLRDLLERLSTRRMES
jgi:cytochrome b subunit of formate dehydrogenase